ncbi:MAG: S41 family peptidase [Candidatus Solibacter sp.]
MKPLILSLILISASSAVHAQNLTAAQKEADFRYLASTYSTYYAPVDWKKQLLNVDVLDIKPWLEKVNQTKTDLDFYEVCVAYVAALKDTHSSFSLPSDFVARLGFTTDVYDGVLLIDSLNRTLLPVKDYPFTFGDRLISIDGRDAQMLLQDVAIYAQVANPIAAKRLAAARITIRPQSLMPHATDVNGTSAKVVIQRLSGDTETYTIPWSVTGTPLSVGPVPSPKMAAARRKTARAQMDSHTPAYMNELLDAQWSGVLNPEETGLNGYGSISPVFLGALGNARFTRRLGGSAADFFYSGTFTYEDLTIGYIRIPNYAPASTAAALLQFEREVGFFNANTSGLIVDEMRNTGGSLCYGESIAARLIPDYFRATGFQLRPYWSRIIGFYNAWINAKITGAPQATIDQYELLFKAMLDANTKGLTLTNSLPLCTSSLDRAPFMDADGNVLAYKKQIMMLIDEFSTSTADSVPGMFRDANRGVLYGMRTQGAGGNNTGFDTGSYSEGFVGMTLALQTRKEKHLNGDYPYTDLIENTGVWPDLTDDYMTKDNLLQSGAPFLRNVLQHMAAQIRMSK